MRCVPLVRRSFAIPHRAASVTTAEELCKISACLITISVKTEKKKKLAELIIGPSKSTYLCEEEKALYNLIYAYVWALSRPRQRKYNRCLRHITKVLNNKRRNENETNECI